MKTMITIILMLAITSLASSQEKRLAYSYLSADFSKSIPESMDKDKLSSKEEKLYKKFMKSLNRSTMVNFNKYLNASLEEQGYKVLPLEAVGVMGNSALNLDGYPFIFFPKKTIKKHKDKDVADVFVSATINISKPLTAVIGMKPTASVTLKLFNNSGELIKKVTAVHKTEKKVSNIGFAVNNNESFSKVDIEHARILYEKVETIVQAAAEDAVNQLSNEE